MKQKFTRVFIGTVTACLLATNAALPAHSAQQEDAGKLKEQLNIAVLGDSYAAGNGAGDYYSEVKSYRSHQAWGMQYARWLQENQRVYSPVQHLAYSGKTGHDVLTEQIPQLKDQTDLVFLQVGFNDTNFRGIVTHCFVPGLGLFNQCKSAISAAHDGLSTVTQDLNNIFDALEQKLKPNAKVVLVSYPLLSSNKRHTPALWGGYDAAEGVRDFGRKLTQTQAEAVKTWKENHRNSGRPEVTFVEDIHTIFEGHEPDPSPWERNPQRWINELFETEGKIKEQESTISSARAFTEVAGWYHLNRTGHAQIAQHLQEKIGRPDNIHGIDQTPIR